MDAREHRAKLFKSGGSQAVRLPKDYRFERQHEVLIRREGERVILEPVKHGWSKRFRALAGAAADFPYPEPSLPADPGPEFR
jgi:antitoxin VapB